MINGTRIVFSVICLLGAFGLAVCIVLERQTCAKLGQENDSARQQLSQMDQLLAENQRLSKLIAEEHGLVRRLTQGEAALTTDEKELVRLRGEVEELREQRKEIEMLRADTRQVRAASETALAARNASQAASRNNVTTTGSGSQFELLTADYWTDRTNMDVAAELRERIRGDGLKAIANNNLKGDPDFGQVKHLTVVYRFGDALFTNEFREGDFVVLPKETER